MKEKLGLAPAGPVGLGKTQEVRAMTMKFIRGLVLVVAAVGMAGCAPLLVGAAGAVVLDEAVERDQGGDGLF